MKKLIVSTTKYVVAEDDTIEKIAARCDCTPSQLMKLNKLPSRILFSGQTIFVPDGTTVEEDASSTASEATPEPASKVQAPPEAPVEEPQIIGFDDLAAELDAECVQKFLKLNANQVTKHDGDIPGVLIVTPNCVMFDPDPRDPTVIAGGPDLYGMVAPIDAVVLVGLYEISHELPTTSSNEQDTSGSPLLQAEDDVVNDSPCKIVIENRHRTVSEDYYANVENDDLDSLPEVVMTRNDVKRRASTSAIGLTSLQVKQLSSISSESQQPQQRRSSFSFPFHFRDQAKHHSSTSPVRKISGLFKRHDKPSNGSEDDSFSSLSGKRKLSLGNKDVSDPSDTHLDFNDGWYPDGDEQLDAEVAKQKENFHALERLKIKTENLRKNLAYYYINPNKTDRSSDLLKDENILVHLPSTVHATSKENTYYLRICLDERRRKKEITKNVGLYDFGDKTRNEFLFAVPPEKVDLLYTLFLQWSSEKHEHESVVVTGRNDTSVAPSEASEKNELGFVFVDDLSQNSRFESEFRSFADSFHEANIKFKWEIVSMHEMKRRLSLLEITEASFLALPDGTDQSKILTEPMVRRIVSFLPARAQAYPWMLIYSSDVHGFSLSTMYRNMNKYKDEMTPVLLVIRDSNQCVFGAVINCVFKVSEHFYGSGESVLFSVFPEFRVYRWTGVNNFIVKGNTDSLAIGSGHGTFGLYLDADFYHGRTQHCDTFDNEPLTITEDFTISGVEAFGFSMTF